MIHDSIIDLDLGNVLQKVEENEESAESLRRRVEASEAFTGRHKAVLR